MCSHAAGDHWRGDTGRPKSASRPPLSLQVFIGCYCCCWTLLWNWGRRRKSRAAPEPPSRLQNKTGKTNTGLKLDFPKHSNPSHFTHHCGLQTRIEKPVKSAVDLVEHSLEHLTNKSPLDLSDDPVFFFFFSEIWIFLYLPFFMCVSKHSYCMCDLTGRKKKFSAPLALFCHIYLFSHSVQPHSTHFLFPFYSSFWSVSLCMGCLSQYTWPKRRTR